MAYDHLSIEKKWQKTWVDKKVFHVAMDASKKKYYALDMFPYPSGAGLHVGHLASYTPTDIVSRFKKMQGYNVLHVMGYDAFGLPAEQYAIKTGQHPHVTTQECIQNFRRQLQSFGYSFDWSREVSTSDPQFYKWTQYIFKMLFDKNLAYQKEVPVNWCPALKTVLANEEVVDGKSERGGHPVVQRPMRQWILKITDYAEQLLEGLNDLNWSERTKDGQRHWIGKSIGCEIYFFVESCGDKITVFTTRPDTLFGATFIILAPEHPLVKKITTEQQKIAVFDYVTSALKKNSVDRKASKEKTGCFTGAYAIHPITKKSLPIWISDYVLLDYGTGSIMAVPGHDERDFEFAVDFNLPVVRVLKSSDGGADKLPYEGGGVLVNSAFLNGLKKNGAIKAVVDHLEEKNLGASKVQYKLRDWIFSRQRFWGEPFPIVHLESGKTVSLDLDELPVTLPDEANYEPSDSGEPPLARSEDFVNYSGAKGKGKRNTDTMPGSAGSSWYFLRYVDPHNIKEPFGFSEQKYWLPVDLYIGGPEHTTGHLLYSRFWTRFLYDQGLVSYPEPYKKLAHQGLIMGPDGQKMSKSRGNTIDPDDVRQKYGADATRLYISFMGPFEKDKPWDIHGIDGSRRFLERVWRLVFNEEGRVWTEEDELSESLKRVLHQTIKKVSEDIEALSFNTAVSSMMILVNEVYKQKRRPHHLLKQLTLLLTPYTPHLAEELWKALGGEGLAIESAWPSYDPDLIKEDHVTMGVQVSGKMRGTIKLSVEASQETAMDLAKQLPSVKKALSENTLVKVIYRPGKILNLITKSRN